jgi:hypothetical protein
VLGAPGEQGFVRLTALELVPAGEPATRLEQVLEAAVGSPPPEEPGHHVVVVRQLPGGEGQREPMAEVQIVLARYREIPAGIVDVLREVLASLLPRVSSVGFAYIPVPGCDGLVFSHCTIPPGACALVE